MKNRDMPLNLMDLRPSHTWFRSQNAVLSNHIWNLYFFKSIMNEQNCVLVPCVHFSIRSLHSQCLWYWLTSNKSSYGWQHWFFYDIPGQQALAQALPNFIQHGGYGGSGFSLHHSKWMSGWKFQMALFYMILYLFTPSSKIPPIFSKIFSPMMSIPCTIHPKPSLSCSPQTPKVH